MNKHLIVIGMTLLLLVVGLSGCNESSNDVEKNKFLGTWISEHGWYNYTINFSSDGKYESHNHIWGDGTYEVKGGKLNLNMDNSNVVFTIDYMFSNNETFTLLYESGDSLLFTKQ